MQRASNVSISVQRGEFRAGSRAPFSLASTWTGRARVSTATDSAVPQCVATTTHRTRVSEMRQAPSRSNCEPLNGLPIRSETYTSSRRNPVSPR